MASPENHRRRKWECGPKAAGEPGLPPWLPGALGSRVRWEPAPALSSTHPHPLHKGPRPQLRPLTVRRLTLPQTRGPWCTCRVGSRVRGISFGTWWGQGYGRRSVQPAGCKEVSWGKEGSLSSPGLFQEEEPSKQDRSWTRGVSISCRRREVTLRRRNSVWVLSCAAFLVRRYKEHKNHTRERIWANYHFDGRKTFQ